MKTSSRELAFAFLGAVLGAALPILLHVEISRVGDPVLWGIPLAIFALPGFFAGAIAGAKTFSFEHERKFRLKE